MDVDIREVTAGYVCRVSNGNFGSEEVSCVLRAGVRPGQDDDGVFAELVGRATESVLGRLSGSKWSAVRQAVSALSGPLAEADRRYDAYQSARMDAERDAQRYVSKPEVDEEDDPTAGGLG
jgi:hypothetical protein